jgi:hypothetical protein
VTNISDKNKNKKKHYNEKQQKKHYNKERIEKEGIKQL